MPTATIDSGNVRGCAIAQRSRSRTSSNSFTVAGNERRSSTNPISQMPVPTTASGSRPARTDAEMITIAMAVPPV